MVYYDHAVSMMLELDRWKRDCGALPSHHQHVGLGQKLPQARKRPGKFGLGLRSAVASIIAAFAIVWVAVA